MTQLSRNDAVFSVLWGSDWVDVFPKKRGPPKNDKKSKEVEKKLVLRKLLNDPYKICAKL